MSAAAAGGVRPEVDPAEVELRPALEAVLLVADRPVDLPTLAGVLHRPLADVRAAADALAEEYTLQRRGFELREVAGGWRLFTRAELAPVVERFVLEGQVARLSRAALETLAVVAYKQPVSRARVAAIRGVSVDGVMRTLASRGLVEEAGHDPSGTATLYRTTPLLLERLGLSSLEELPELAPLLPDLEDLDDPDDLDDPERLDGGPSRAASSGSGAA